MKMLKGMLEHKEQRHVDVLAQASPICLSSAVGDRMMLAPAEWLKNPCVEHQLQDGGAAQLREARSAWVSLCRMCWTHLRTLPLRHHQACQQFPFLKVPEQGF